MVDRGIDSVCEIPIHGYINDIAIGPEGRFCVAAVGQEHRLGRWDRVPKAKNRFAIIRWNDMSFNDEIDEEDEENQSPHMYPSSGNNADDDNSSSSDDDSASESDDSS